MHVEQFIAIWLGEDGASMTASQGQMQMSNYYSLDSELLNVNRVVNHCQNQVQKV